LIISHEISEDDGSTPAHPGIAVHKYVSKFAIVVDEVQALLKMLHYREVFLVVGIDLLMERNILNWVADG